MKPLGSPAFLLCSVLSCVVTESDSEAPAEVRPPADGVACGDTRCSRLEVCAIVDQRPACFRRGMEPEIGSPTWPSAILECDGDRDCPGTQRCTIVRGEVVRTKCTEEDPKSCVFHSNHVCASDRDCHSCARNGHADLQFTCRANLYGLPISGCDFH